MRLVIAAIGQRQPAWAEEAYADFAKRFPPELKLELKALKAEPRTAGKPASAMMAAEAQRLEAAIPKGARRVVLDERGTRMTTVQLADRLRFWLGDGRDVVFLVGGPDGLDAALKATADETLRISDLTLPHAFVRVLLAEALYRAWSVTAGHPYHRE
ncbi:MAG: 23S rRNA (pseudouridine(1915)-N(3))-methyltransferase RlmH [Aquincola tertiaricarbonis]|uniref:23S rRNA (pseudouridine(1915)-N(3))-methyltransferase RlmH n=1 Tax=Aquincola TaxID=391952 RepID=UPI000614F7F0|nr:MULTISPECIES: 23S rRNA (pseudouridine(1915)-N(3))-methyltransferase RlmH [Aquincola]MCR5865361.1 23S rRNA (pseudouridine(1915)-N(3))-methyltransferase RlmH [Aquincola sp. J276]